MVVVAALLIDGSFWLYKAEVIVTLAGRVTANSDMARALINASLKASRGEVIEIYSTKSYLLKA